MPEEYHTKNLNARDLKRLIEYADQENVDIDKVIDLIKKNDFVKKNQKGDDNKMAEFKTREQKVEEYILAHPGVNYRTAVLESGVDTREDYLAPDEAVRIAGLLDGGISAVDLTKELNIFSQATRKKLNEAYRILTDAKVELELIAEKPLKK